MFISKVEYDATRMQEVIVYLVSERALDLLKLRKSKDPSV